MEQGIISSFKPSAPQSEQLRIAIYCAIESRGCGALGNCWALCTTSWQIVSVAFCPLRCSELQRLCSHSTSFLWASAGAPLETSPAQCHTSTLPSEGQSVTQGFSPVFEASCYISTSSKLPLCPKPSPQMQIALTLLTRMSVASKCRPYILGDSPGIGSILTHTSWPFFATSTGLWFISILVTIPISTNCNTMKQL